MNPVTIQQTTQGLLKYLQQQAPQQLLQHGVIIGAAAATAAQGVAVLTGDMGLCISATGRENLCKHSQACSHCQYSGWQAFQFLLLSPVRADAGFDARLLSCYTLSRSAVADAGFDARHNSRAYAELAAAVFASAGVKVSLIGCVPPWSLVGGGGGRRHCFLSGTCKDCCSVHDKATSITPAPLHTYLHAPTPPPTATPAPPPLHTIHHPPCPAPSMPAPCFWVM
jgi:hypothetical protein